MKLQKRAQTCLIISVAIFVLALVLTLCGRGVNMGIDFAGGLSIKYEMGSAFEQSDVETALRNAGIDTFQIAKAGDAKTELQIRVLRINDEAGVQALRQSLETELSAKYPDMKVDDATVGYVGAVASATLLKNAFLSVLIATALMLVYIAIRFDFNSGVSAVFGLVHDVLMMFSFMVIFRSIIQMNSTFIAAMLTIVGYSINNTIIIFDRIRENNKMPINASMDRAKLAQMSVKECLGRTINTTLTTLCTILMLYILGVDSIKEFALPIIVGILAGMYSANLINGYIWAALTDWRNKRRATVKAKPVKAGR